MNVSNVNQTSQFQKTERLPKNQLGKDDFLAILSAQLRYQDPLSGGDNTQYIAQLAQFSSLEQMQNLNLNISELVYFQNVQYGSQMVGKSVTVKDGQQQITGVVEKVSMKNGEINIVVNGNPYQLYQVEEISLSEEVV